MGNRVQEAIDRLEAKLAAMNGQRLDGRPLSDLDRRMTLTLQEFTAYQNAQAQATGRLTTEEAQTVARPGGRPAAPQGAMNRMF